MEHWDQLDLVVVLDVNADGPELREGLLDHLERTIHRPALGST